MARALNWFTVVRQTRMTPNDHYIGGTSLLASCAPSSPHGVSGERRMRGCDPSWGMCAKTSSCARYTHVVTHKGRTKDQSLVRIKSTPALKDKP